MTATAVRAFAWFAALTALVAGGCNIAGPAFYFLHGPEKTPAAYTLDQARSTVIFIDDRTNRIPSRATRDLIGKTAEEELLNREVVADMVQSRKIQTVVARERYGKPMGIAEVGRAVDAKVVIYAWVDQFTLATDGQTFAPAAALRLKVVDADSGERLFPGPETDGWYSLSVVVPPQQGSVPDSTALRQQAEQNLARYVGQSLARVFYEHESVRSPADLEDVSRP
ncbi:MAG: hypothetical protein ACKVS8_08440 [Phycisphaerales bacterium]